MGVRRIYRREILTGNNLMLRRGPKKKSLRLTNTRFLNSFVIIWIYSSDINSGKNKNAIICVNHILLASLFNNLNIYSWLSFIRNFAAVITRCTLCTILTFISGHAILITRDYTRAIVYGEIIVYAQTIVIN